MTAGRRKGARMRVCASVAALAQEALRCPQHCREVSILGFASRLSFVVTTSLVAQLEPIRTRWSDMGNADSRDR